ncbi:MAG: AAA family ATPase [Syntrophales bacterium]|nr:AAA family ATPase [Syntrophales bacterium]MCK9528857.1 AAA family ATPase [Syntrophales bacterium]MDX9921169.1 AAA family ATPase [Syntrophales bacterium]
MHSPSFYPHHPSSVELIQTHISYVFLAGNRVYKVKKPVRFDFLDFSTLERRKHFCEEELRLNRRLAPTVYVSVEPITDEGPGGLVLGGTGPPVEYALHMKRLPEERMLYRLLERGSADLSVMDAIARRICDFHREADTGGAIDALGGLDTIRRNNDENFEETRSYRDVTISAAAHSFLKDWVNSFLDRNRELFHRRVREHRIRDCHGDLHLEHICLDGDDIVIFDCIEFKERFRYLDVAAEIAFLSMDLGSKGYHGHDRAFVDAYLRYSGDREIQKLLNFYRCYFAFVRGKVTSFRIDDPATAEKDRARIADEASQYFDGAVRYAARLDTPALLILSGLMGTGKSSLARRLADSLDAGIIRTDVLRKEMLGIQPADRHHEPFGRGIYSDEISRETYHRVLEQAGVRLASGETVIIDASFRKQEERERARAIAKRQGADFLVIECVCPEEEIRARLDRRQRKGNEASDGRWELYESQKKSFEPLKDILPGEHVLVDTSRPLADSLMDALRRIRRLDRE